MEKTLGLVFSWGCGAEVVPQAVDPSPKGGLRTGVSPVPNVPLLSSFPTGSEARKDPGSLAFYLGRTSEDSDTSLPSRVSIFFTTTVLEELVLERLE